MSGHLLKDKALVVGGLVVAADSQVDRGADAIGAHSSAQPSLWNHNAMIPPIPKLSNYAPGNGRHVAAILAMEASQLGRDFEPSPDWSASLPKYRFVDATEARGRASVAVTKQPEIG